jgi:hypothetical protein
LKNKENFERLCRALCKRPGISGTGVEHRGSLSVLPVTLQNVDTFLLYAADVDPDTACIVIALGSLAGNELAGWQGLLEANHAMRGTSAPRFARDPETNEALLQYAFKLEGVTPEDLHARIEAMATMAHDWKRRQLGVMQ